MYCDQSYYLCKNLLYLDDTKLNGYYCLITGKLCTCKGTECKCTCYEEDIEN